MVHSKKGYSIILLLFLLLITTLSYTQGQQDSTIQKDIIQSNYLTNNNHHLLYLIVVLLLGIMVLAYREYKLKKRAYIDLTLQKTEIETQKQIVEKRNRDITDSLNYAQRIQQAILKTSLRLEEFFKESFINSFFILSFQVFSKYSIASFISFGG